MEQMRERVARAIWVAKGFDENTLHQHHEWEDWPVDKRTEHVDFDGKTVVTLLHYAWRKCLPEADAALSLMQPEIDRRVAEEKAKLLAGLREPSEAMIETGGIFLDEMDGNFMSDNDRAAAVWQAMLAQYEKEQQP